MERQKVNNFVQKMLKDADLKDAWMLLFKRCYLLRYGHTWAQRGPRSRPPLPFAVFCQPTTAYANRTLSSHIKAIVQHVYAQLTSSEIKDPLVI
jgi:hypothetical protein